MQIKISYGISINSLQSDLLETLLEAVQNTATKATLPASEALQTGSELLHGLGL